MIDTVTADRRPSRRSRPNSPGLQDLDSRDLQAAATAIEPAHRDRARRRQEGARAADPDRRRTAARIARAPGDAPHRRRLAGRDRDRTPGHDISPALRTDGVVKSALGLEGEDLNLDLGPLGTLLGDSRGDDRAMSHDQDRTGVAAAIAQMITCAFCRGEGTDPFGVMSDRSVCGACGGRGVVTRAGAPRALRLLRRDRQLQDVSLPGMRRVPGSSRLPRARPRPALRATGSPASDRAGWYA